MESGQQPPIEVGDLVELPHEELGEDLIIADQEGSKPQSTEVPEQRRINSTCIIGSMFVRPT